MMLDRKYISRDDRVYWILEYLIKNPLAGPSRLQYVSQSAQPTWLVLKPILLDNGLVTVTTKLPPHIKNRKEAYTITPTGIAYYQTMKRYREAVTEIQTKEKALRGGKKPRK